MKAFAISIFEYGNGTVESEGEDAEKVLDDTLDVTAPADISLQEKDDSSSDISNELDGNGNKPDPDVPQLPGGNHASHSQTTFEDEVLLSPSASGTVESEAYDAENVVKASLDATAPSDISPEAEDATCTENETGAGDDISSSPAEFTESTKSDSPSRSEQDGSVMQERKSATVVANDTTEESLEINEKGTAESDGCDAEKLVKRKASVDVTATADISPEAEDATCTENESGTDVDNSSSPAEFTELKRSDGRLKGEQVVTVIEHDTTEESLEIDEKDDFSSEIGNESDGIGNEPDPDLKQLPEGNDESHSQTTLEDQISLPPSASGMVESEAYDAEKLAKASLDATAPSDINPEAEAATCTENETGAGDDISSSPAEFTESTKSDSPLKSEQDGSVMQERKSATVVVNDTTEESLEINEKGTAESDGCDAEKVVKRKASLDATATANISPEAEDATCTGNETGADDDISSSTAEFTELTRSGSPLKGEHVGPERKVVTVIEHNTTEESPEIDEKGGETKKTNPDSDSTTTNRLTDTLSSNKEEVVACFNDRSDFAFEKRVIDDFLSRIGNEPDGNGNKPDPDLKQLPGGNHESHSQTTLEDQVPLSTSASGTVKSDGCDTEKLVKRKASLDVTAPVDISLEAEENETGAGDDISSLPAEFTESTQSDSPLKSKEVVSIMQERKSITIVENEITEESCETDKKGKETPKVDFDADPTTSNTVTDTVSSNKEEVCKEEVACFSDRSDFAFQKKEIAEMDDKSSPIPSPRTKLASELWEALWEALAAALRELKQKQLDDFLSWIGNEADGNESKPDPDLKQLPGGNHESHSQTTLEDQVSPSPSASGTVESEGHDVVKPVKASLDATAPADISLGAEDATCAENETTSGDDISSSPAEFTESAQSDNPLKSKEDGSVMQGRKSITIADNKITEESLEIDEKEVDEFSIVVRDHVKVIAEVHMEESTPVPITVMKMDGTLGLRESKSKEQFNDCLTKIELRQLHEVQDKAVINHVMILGDPGSGKTTIAKQYARLYNGTDAFSSIRSSALGVELVCFIQIAKIQTDLHCTPFDLIFVQQIGSKLRGKMKQAGRRWTQENPEKLLFILDGLDQAKTRFGGEYPVIGPDTPSHTNVILANIMSGHLYPGAKILSTARWHTYWDLTPDHKPDRTIALPGYDHDVAKKKILGLLPDELKELAASILFFPEVLDLASNPMFMAYIVEALSELPPDLCSKLPAVMVVVLSYFTSSKHKSNTQSKFSKVAELAFNAIKDNRSSFGPKYVEKFWLDSENLHDFLRTKAKVQRFQHHIELEDLRMSFNHKVFQEILAAFHICNLPRADFEKCVMGDLCRERFGVTRALVYGFLLNADITNIAERYLPDDPLEIGAKRRILGKNLGSVSLKSDMDVILFHQCVPLKKVKIDKLVLSSGNLALLAGSIGSTECLEVGTLVIGYNTKAEDCPAIAQILHKVSLQSLYLDCPDEVGEDEVWESMKSIEVNELRATSRTGFKCLGAIMHAVKAQQLYLGNCDLTEEKLEVLQGSLCSSKIHGSKLKKLFLNGNKDLCPEGFQYISKLVKKTGVKILCLRNCDLTGAKLNVLTKSLYDEGVKISQLEIDKNKDFGPMEFKELANLIETSQIFDLSMRHCFLKNCDMKALTGSLDGKQIKLHHFILDGNTSIETEGFAYIADIVEKANVRVLSMRHCGLTSEKLRAFNKYLRGKSIKIHRLYLDGNDQLGAKGFEALASVMKTVSVRELYLRNCDLSVQTLEAFSKSLAGKNIHVHGLVVDGNTGMHFSAMRHLVEVVANVQLDVLWMEECRLEVAQLDAFSNSMTEKVVKVKELHLSQRVSEVTEEHISSVCRLLHCIHDALVIKEWSLSSSQKTRLKEELCTMDSTGIEIHVGTGVTRDIIHQKS